MNLRALFLAALTLAPLPALGQQVTSLPDANLPLSGAEFLYIVQNGISRRITASSFASSGGGTVQITGSPVAGNLTMWSGLNTITNGNLSGDCTTSGTLAITCTKSGGLAFGTMAFQNAVSVAITGGTINGTTIGATTPATGAFTTLTINPLATNPLTISNTNFALTGTGNASYNFKTLGTGNFNFYTQGGSNQQFQINDTASSLSYIRVQGGASGNGPTVQVVNDTAARLNLTTGATGWVQTNTGTGLNVSGGLAFGKAVTYVAGSGVGPVSGTNVAPLWFNANYTGTLNTGAGSMFEIQLGDTIKDSRGGPPAYFGYTQNLNAGYNGHRSMFALILNKNAASATGGTNYGYQLTNFFVHALAGDGGTAALPLGSFGVMNPDIQCNTGDWINSCWLTEEDIRLYSGTNTPAKYIHAFHYAINDAVHALPKTGDPAINVIDTAIAIDASPTIGNGSGKGITLIALGNWTQDVPWDTTPSLGTSIMKVFPNAASNMSGVGQAYIDDGFSLKALFVRGNLIDNGNFVAKGNGDVVSGVATLAATSTGASLDVTGIVETSAAVVFGGLGAKVGTQLTDSVGGIWEVATVAGTAVTSVTLKRGQALTVCPASPTTTVGFNMGQGQPTLNITCSAARTTLALQPSAGLTTMGGAANVAGTLTLGAGGAGGQRIQASGTGNFVVQLGGAASVMTIFNSGGSSLLQLLSGVGTTIGQVTSKAQLGIQTQNTNTPVYAGASPGAMVPITSNMTWSGSCTTVGNNCPLVFDLTSTSNIDAGTAGVVQGNLTLNLGAGFIGPAHALNIKTSQTATTGSTANVYTALNMISQMLANDGGTALATGSVGGAVTVMNPVAHLGPSATFVSGLSIMEMDIYAEAGSSVLDKAGLLIDLISLDRVQGSRDDVAFNFDAQSTLVPGWRTIIGIGSTRGQTPLDAINGWILQFLPHLGAGTIAGAGGLDFNLFTPTTAFIRGTTFSLSPTGIWTAAGYVTAGTVKITPITVASLVTCNAGTKGSISTVTDANAPTYNTNVAGGGAVSIPVYCDGANWKSH